MLQKAARIPKDCQARTGSTRNAVIRFGPRDFQLQALPLGLVKRPRTREATPPSRKFFVCSAALAFSASRSQAEPHPAENSQRQTGIAVFSQCVEGRALARPREYNGADGAAPSNSGHDGAWHFIKRGLSAGKTLPACWFHPRTKLCVLASLWFECEHAGRTRHYPKGFGGRVASQRRPKYPDAWGQPCLPKSDTWGHVSLPRKSFGRMRTCVPTPKICW